MNTQLNTISRNIEQVLRLASTLIIATAPAYAIWALNSIPVLPIA